MSRRGAPSQGPAPLRDVLIVGGGCYGTFYARQLETAVDRGGLALRRVILMDRDPGCRAAKELPTSPARELRTVEWHAGLREFLDTPAPPPGEPDDAVVPSPLMPHLFAEWLAERAHAHWPDRPARLVTPPEPFGTPYDAVGPDGVRYVSFADWICPTHCVEPLVCPMIRGPRTWEMGDAFGDYARRLAGRGAVAGPALFTTRHHAYGVGMIHAREIRAGLALLADAGASRDPIDLLIGTVSACHGAASLLRIG
ncbi:MAG: hypothetical protein ACRENB_02270 [Gemmatimonadales bacterium]